MYNSAHISCEVYIQQCTHLAPGESQALFNSLSYDWFPGATEWERVRVKALLSREVQEHASPENF